MKQRYIDAVNRVRSIVEREIKNEKSCQYILIQIEEMLCETANIEDMVHFSRYHFQKLVGESIVSYIKKKQMEYAVYKDKEDSTNLGLKDTYKNVSRYKYKRKKGGIKMKKYLVVERHRMEKEMEEMMWWLDEEADNEMKLVEAFSKEDAIRQYSDLQYELEAERIVKGIIFREFWGLTYYGDCDFFDSFPHADKIMELAGYVYEKYFMDEECEPEESILKYDVSELVDSFFEILNDQERKTVYCAYNRWNLICVELVRFPDYKERKIRNAKNIIDDIQIDDIEFWNVLSKMIRNEKKDSYFLDEDVFREYGIGSERAQKLLQYCVSGQLKHVVGLDFDGRAFCYRTLYNKMRRGINHDEKDNLETPIRNVVIFPADILYKLAEAGYDFKDGKNEIAIKILSDNRCL